VSAYVCDSCLRGDHSFHDTSAYRLGCQNGDQVCNCPEDSEVRKMASNTFDVLSALVAKLRCKPGWRFQLIDEDGALRLAVTVPGVDTYSPGQELTVRHFFPVPVTTFNEKSWCRWLFEQCRRLENHELGEWFRIGEARPFAPLHGPGEDPYTVHEYRNEADARVLQNGSVTETDITGSVRSERDTVVSSQVFAELIRCLSRDDFFMPDHWTIVLVGSGAKPLTFRDGGRT
jgi:hypothetical protein